VKENRRGRREGLGMPHFCRGIKDPAPNPALGVSTG